jgi:hypothetical protein
MDLKAVPLSDRGQPASFLVHRGNDVIGGLSAESCKMRQESVRWNAAVFESRGYGVRVIRIGIHPSTQAALDAIRDYLSAQQLSTTGGSRPRKKRKRSR